MLRTILRPSHHKYKMLPSKADATLHIARSTYDSTDDHPGTQHPNDYNESFPLKAQVANDLKLSFHRNT